MSKHAHQEMSENTANDEEKNANESAVDGAETGDMQAAMQALLDAKDTEIASLKDQHLRALAEMENLRRRFEREQSDTAKYAITGFARELVEVLENLKRAADAVPVEARGEHHMLDTIAVGVEMTLKSLMQAFEKQGIIRIDPIGEKFDHNLHQAISQAPSHEVEPGTVLNVMQAGYKIHDRLLRPAMVVVATRPENATHSGDGAGTQVDTSA